MPEVDAEGLRDVHEAHRTVDRGDRAPRVGMRPPGWDATRGRRRGAPHGRGSRRGARRWATTTPRLVDPRAPCPRPGSRRRPSARPPTAPRGARRGWRRRGRSARGGPTGRAGSGRSPPRRAGGRPPRSAKTTEPIASRGQRRAGSPTRRTVSQCPARLPPSLRRSSGPSSMSFTRTSTSPSLSRSPTADPRMHRARRGPRRPSPRPPRTCPRRFRKSRARWRYDVFHSKPVHERVDVAVGHEQVEPAVVVVVEEVGAPAQEGDADVADPRGEGHVGEEAVAVVVVEDVRSRRRSW